MNLMTPYYKKRYLVLRTVLGRVRVVQDLNFVVQGVVFDVSKEHSTRIFQIKQGRNVGQTSKDTGSNTNRSEFLAQKRNM